MLKVMAGVAMFIMLQVQPLRPQAQAQPANHPSATQAHQQPESQPTVINNVDNRQSREEGAKENPISSKKDDEYARKGFIVNSIIAGITLIIAVAALIQASAANKQASHIVIAERAWITVSPDDRHPKLYPAWEPGTALPADPLTAIAPPVMHQFSTSLKNSGKTPAQISEAATRYICIASMDDLPEEPSYGTIHPHRRGWIVPGDEYFSNVQLETNNGVLWESQVQDLKNRKAFLFVFGIVKYRDAFRNPHETRFGFQYEFPIPGVQAADGSEIKPCFRRAGPEKYNYAD